MPSAVRLTRPNIVAHHRTQGQNDGEGKDTIEFPALVSIAVEAIESGRLQPPTPSHSSAVNGPRDCAGHP